MFLFYALSFFKKGDTVQGNYSRKYGISAFIFLSSPFLDARAEICIVFVGFLEYFKTKIKSSEISWPLFEQDCSKKIPKVCYYWNSDLNARAENLNLKRNLVFRYLTFLECFRRHISINFRWDSFPLFQILNDYLRTDGDFCIIYSGPAEPEGPGGHCLYHSLLFLIKPWQN